MCSVTLVHAPTTTERRLSKAIVRAPADSDQPVAIVQVDDLPYHCDLWEHEIDTVEDVHTLLLQLAGDVSTCVIRARPLVSYGRRLTQEDPVTGDAITLEEVPRQWVAVDFDSVDAPSDLDFCAEPHKAAQHVRSLLPLAFRTAACVWRATGSAGFKPGIRLHLWFVLTEPVAGDFLERWLEGAPIDKCTLRPNQPIFTADPVFVGDVPDPMVGGRLGVLGGSPRVHVPDARTVGTTGANETATAHSYTPEEDSLKLAALARWEAAHPWPYVPGTSERFPCPACGSSDGIAVRLDGKWNCHSSKHAEVAPSVGSWTGAVHVGHRTEFEEGLSARELVPWLKREGYWLTSRLPARFTHAEAAEEAEPEVLEEAEPEWTTGAAGTEKETPPPVVRVAALPQTLQSVPEISANNPQPRTDSKTNGAGVKSPPPAGTTGAAGTVIDLEAARERKAREEAAESSDKYTRSSATVRALVREMSAIRKCVVWDVRAHRVLVRSAPPWRPEDPRAVPRPLSDTDGIDLCLYLSEARGYHYANRGECLACLESLAQSSPWDPVREYLDGLTWPGTVGEAWNWLGRVPREVLGVESSPEMDAYITAAFARWAIGAVQRTYEPGCMFREVLTLIGEQNIGKSQFLRRLCANPDWFTDTVSADGSKDSRSALDGKWLVEFGELDKHMREDRSGAFKNYISTQVDTYRRSYGRTDNDYLRRCVFAATSNHEDLFVDSTGNSRFNILHVTKIDLALTVEWRDRIWSAAKALYLAGEPAYLQPAELVTARRLQSAAYAESSVEAIVRELWEAPAPAGGRQLRGAPDYCGFDFSAAQVGADGLWLVLTTGQLRDHLRSKGYTHNVDKLIRSTCRAMRLVNGRSARELTGNPMRAWGRPEAVTVGLLSRA